MTIKTRTVDDGTRIYVHIDNDGNERRLNADEIQDYLKAKALKERAIKGVVSGAGIATGVAVGETVITAGAAAAETAAVAIETVAIIPAVLTVAAVGAGCYGLYKIYECFADS